MTERLKFRRVRKGLWRHGTFMAERTGSKWIVRKGHKVVCEGAKDLTAASKCIIKHRSE